MTKTKDLDLLIVGEKIISKKTQTIIDANMEELTREFTRGHILYCERRKYFQKKLLSLTLDLPKMEKTVVWHD